ncbi:MAG: 4-(cytidine 5'-diphospho)-2-C-methyl-D-erythritol kinase [Acidobacteriaceae bacterium]|nr:4-(cytidine 5'-diphospho)-2-C-methyl-D-erythritol kinase [Acidobacteriaceae bacterium]MBV9781398.1 4-(cytidine 5'-diphospho)-2-C-methyl-D-erythritol kinase [Acidobacteriaceae bacterium]
MQVTLPCFAKLNLDLRVLHKRPDGYHELRTIFQTISLKDTLQIQVKPAESLRIDLSSSIDIEDNLVVRSAKLVLDHLGSPKVWVRFVIDKQIPIGAGLGGGSSDAAAVFIALPALLGRPIPFADLVRFAESLGSDIPFFLHGGTALGFGRGTELYPLPDIPSYPALVVSSGIHVSTPQAYEALGRTALTSPGESHILREFQANAWKLAESSLDQIPLKNDFEEPVFRMHEELALQARKLRSLGAEPVLMTGSGSALFGIFGSAGQARSAASNFPPGMAHPVRFISRRRYKSIWRRSLGSAAGASCFA